MTKAPQCGMEVKALISCSQPDLLFTWKLHWIPGPSVHVCKVKKPFIKCACVSFSGSWHVVSLVFQPSHLKEDQIQVTSKRGHMLGPVRPQAGSCLLTACPTALLIQVLTSCRPPTTRTGNR